MVKIRKEDVSRRAKRDEKAKMYFMVYRHLGEGRTLKWLYESARSMGARISLNSLERYSRDYHWQEQILQLNAKEHETQEKNVLAKVDEMNDLHARIARGWEGIVLAAMNRIQDNMKIDQQIRQKNLPPGQTAPLMIDLTIQDMVNLGKNAQTMERFARGQATSRTEVWIEVVDTVVNEFALIFLAVNKIKDENERMNEFGRLSDEMITRYYSKTVKQGVKLAEKSKG
jgi:hypothetical protein